MQPGIYKTVLRPDDAHVLERLPRSIRDGFYLAGGTGLALRIGHRFSFDLDFFSEHPFRNESLRRDLASIGKLEIFQDSSGTLEGMLQKTRLTFLHDPNPAIGPESDFGGIRLASLADMAAMKLSAVSSRGSRKDFIDLFFVKEAMEWPDIVEAFKKRYRGSGFNLFHVIKSLGWFDDAEKEPMPRMIRDCPWEGVKAYFWERQEEMAKREAL